MHVDVLFTWVARSCFVLLAILTLHALWRYRDRARLDIALLFNVFAILFVIQVLAELFDIRSTLLSAIGLMALVSQPHLTLRLVEHFRTVPQWVKRVSLFGLLLIWLLLLTLATTAPIFVILVIVVYFVFVDGYVTQAFLQNARATLGVTRQRLLLAAWGSGLVGLVIFLLGLGVVVPVLAPLTGSLSGIGAAIIAICYYLAFAPPRWLRRIWQMSEMYGFLAVSAQYLSEQRTDDFLDTLCKSATRTGDAQATVVCLWDADTERFVVRATDNATLVGAAFAGDSSEVQRAWNDHQAVVVAADSGTRTELNDLAARVRSQTYYMLPIITPRRVWGLLIVFLQHGSLFPHDDLTHLSLLAGQGAITLEHESLIADQQQLVNQLQHEVLERTQAETHILQLNNALEHRAVELQNANQELEAFSYSVSHDLRAPLRAVDGFSRILLEDYVAELPESAVRYLNLVRTNTQQMGQLIDDLLTFSRLSRQPLSTRPVALRDIVNKVWADLEDEQADRQIALEVEELPVCEADPALLQQVFVNLLGNALKFTSKRDQTHIVVGCQQDGDERVFFVRDNGVGFDMRYAHKLFGVFQRLHRAEDYDGTGVGLATVQRIIHRHGGRIWAESELDKGTTFYFTLEGDGANG